MNEKNEECCPVGEPCEEPVVEEVKPEEVKHVNPYEIPYVPSSHVQELIARKKKRDKKLKIVQKKK
tara:strand:- start:262 stop:459 length:198 start_codon:yes stop_codon:yes gene_type:complete